MGWLKLNARASYVFVFNTPQSPFYVRINFKLATGRCEETTVCGIVFKLGTQIAYKALYSWENVRWSKTAAENENLLLQISKILTG